MSTTRGNQVSGRIDPNVGGAGSVGAAPRTAHGKSALPVQTPRELPSHRSLHQHYTDAVTALKAARLAHEKHYTELRDVLLDHADHALAQILAPAAGAAS